MTAYLTAPGYREIALERTRKQLPSLYKRETTLEGAMQYQLNPQFAPDNFRFSKPTQNQMESISMKQIRDWLTPHLTESYLEVSVVGDIDIEQIITEVAQTLRHLGRAS